MSLEVAFLVGETVRMVVTLLCIGKCVLLERRVRQLERRPVQVQLDVHVPSTDSAIETLGWTGRGPSPTGKHDA